MIEIPALMRELAIKRPLFHSEADFQHALAWRIHKRLPDSDVRLEYRPPVKSNMHLDVWLAKPGIAIELKYRTRKLETKHNGEFFRLRNQSACDIGRYDFLKDIQRLESLSGIPDAKAGFAVFLTNEHLYWKGPTRKDTVDAAFSLRGDPSLIIERELAWDKDASAGTRRGREKPIRLKRSYEARWRHYSSVLGNSYGEFRYLMVGPMIG